MTENKPEAPLDGLASGGADDVHAEIPQYDLPEDEVPQSDLDEDEVTEDAPTDEGLAGASIPSPRSQRTRTARPASRPARSTKESGRLRRLPREVERELRRVTWPTRSQTVGYTLVVVVFLAVFVVLVSLFDLGLASAAFRLFK